VRLGSSPVAWATIRASLNNNLDHSDNDLARALTAYYAGTNLVDSPDYETVSSLSGGDSPDYHPVPPPI
jgi:hypothetical protein